MKHSLLSLVLALVILLGACSVSAPSDIDAPFEFFFPADSAHGTVCGEAVSLDASDITISALLQQYLSAEPPEGCQAVLPESWTLESAEADGITVSVVLTGDAAGALERSIACACLAKTLLQLDGILRVSLLTPGNDTPLLLTQDDILLDDTGMLPQQESVVLYFPDAQRRYLVGERRTVEAMDASEKPRFIVEQLLLGQTNSCIPAKTTLLGIAVEDGVCTVNLSSQFVEGMERSFTAERMAVYSIVNSLTELPDIRAVELWISGAPPEAPYLLDLSASFSRNEALLASPVSGDLHDVTLYVGCVGSKLLVPIPMTLTVREDDSEAELLLQALLAYDGESGGVVRCIPAGTMLLSLRVENGACIIDLTGKFLDGCPDESAESMAVRSLVSTMGTLAEINSVEILVEGLPPAYRSSTLKYITLPQSDWFAQ